MRKPIIEKILERLDVAAEETAKLLELIAAGKAGYWKVRSQQWKTSEPPSRTLAEWYRERRSFYSLLAYLKKEGLITQARKKRGRLGALWQITKKGLERLKAGEKRHGPAEELPAAKRYKKSKARVFTLFVFDIPERYKHKRAWLRDALRWLGFSMLQKSVWVGKRGLPEDFLHDLRRMELLSCIHILTIQNPGTIRHFGQKEDS